MDQFDLIELYFKSLLVIWVATMPLAMIIVGYTFASFEDSGFWEWVAIVLFSTFFWPICVAGCIFEVIGTMKAKYHERRNT